jgi:hypothetical protein
LQTVARFKLVSLGEFLRGRMKHYVLQVAWFATVSDIYTTCIISSAFLQVGCRVNSIKRLVWRGYGGDILVVVMSKHVFVLRLELVNF